ncbi:hypothetical protein PFISCL1PPCAC_11318, partial [Pristionchus fissidentatus]
RFNRRNQQRAHLSMHCLPISEGAGERSGPPSAFSAVARRGNDRNRDGIFARPGGYLTTMAPSHLRAHSMADLHRGIDEADDALDFSSQASVSRWTSRIFAELESLPGSMVDIRQSAQSINRLGTPSDTVSMTSSTLSMMDSRAMTSSMTSDNRSIRSSTLTDGDGLDATTVSSRLAQSINDLDQLLMESSTISIGSTVPGDTVVNLRQIDNRPPVPPHRSIYGEEGWSSGSTSSMIGSIDMTNNRLSIQSVNTEASGETLKIDENDESIGLSRSNLTLDIASLEEEFEADCVEEEAEPPKDFSTVGDEKRKEEETETRREIERIPACPPPKQQKPKRRSVLEDDKYPLLQSIYRLSQSMYDDSPSDEREEERMERWKRNKKASCVDRLSSQQQRAAKVASAVSIDTPPPSVEHIVQSLLRATKKSERRDAITQTSPALSRSSSFDWLETDSVVSALPSTPISLTREEHSSGEDAADLEVRAVNSAASARKMRLDQTMDESLALLHLMAKDTTEQSIVSPRNSRLSRQSRDSSALRSSTIVQQPPAAAAVVCTLQPAHVSTMRSTASSAMSESVYDNVHSERSRDEEDDEEDILSVTSSERPSKDINKRQSALKTYSVPTRNSSSPRTSRNIEQMALPSTSADNSAAIKSPLSKAEDKSIEACRWLRSAGFPQYAHAYEEGSFPLQLDSVIADHAGILDTDSINALSKRIATLNRCAIMRMDGVVLRDRCGTCTIKSEPNTRGMQSSIINDQLNSMHSDEDGVALSGNWRYQRHSQTWARMADVRGAGSASAGSSAHPAARQLQHGLTIDRPVDQQQRSGGEQREGTARNSMLQRSHSERIKERAKAIMKKMDVRSNKQKKEQPPMVISDPILLSYDTASPPSMRMLPVGTSSRIPVNGQRAHGFISSHDLDEFRIAPIDRRLNVETRGMIGSTIESDEEQEDIRDSGAGSSLSRSPSSNPCTLRIRQSVITPSSLPLSTSFSSSTTSSTSSWSRKPETQQSVIPATPNECFFTEGQLLCAIDALSVTQLIFYRKTCYGRLTGALEKYMCGRGEMINIEDESTGSQSSRMFSASVQKLFKRITNGEARTVKDSHAIFGVALSDIRRRYGTCIPHCISEIIRYLRVHSPEAVGIFRKNGVKSRINELKAMTDTEKEGDIFQDEQALTASQVHDVADLLKQYLRELPDPLMTTRLSKTFANVFEYLPESERLTNLRYALVLLPAENREALQTLLFFLHEVAAHSATNNMSADNIAVCLTPSLFHLTASRLNSVTPSRRHKTIGGTGMPTEAEMSETRAAQKCLSTLITNVGELFVVAKEDLSRMEGERRAEHETDFPLVKTLSEIGPRGYLNNKIGNLVKEHDERWRGWIVEGTHEEVEMSSKKPVDGHALKHFRVWTDIEAPPRELLNRIKDKRVLWDSSVLCQRTMVKEGNDLDIFQYVINDSPGHPTRDFFVVRLAVSDLNIRGACALVERSVACSETQLLGGVSAAVLDSNWLIEPHSQGRSRVTLMSRVDLRGRCPSWYNMQYGYVLAHLLARLRDTYKRHDDDGPETKI